MKLSSKHIITFLVLTLSLVLPAQIVAQEDVTENLKNRLKETLEDSSINQVSSPPLLGLVGTVKDIVKNTIVVEDKSGKKNVVVPDDATILRTPGSSAIEIENVRIGDSIIAMGGASDNEQEIIGKRIIVSENTLTPPEKLTGIGIIKDIKRYSLILDTDNDPELEVFFTNKTLYKSPLSTLQLKDLTLGDKILFTAGLDKDEDWSASVVMRMQEALTSEE